MAIKDYFNLPKFLEVGLQHQLKFSDILKTLGFSGGNSYLSADG